MADAVACTVRLPPTLAPIYLHLDDQLPVQNDTGARSRRRREPGHTRDRHTDHTAMTSQANGATRAHVETTPRPQCQPSSRLGVEDTWRSRDTISSAPRSLRTHKCAGSRIAMLLLFFLPSRRRQNALLSAPRARANPLTSSYSAATPPSATCSSPLLPLI